MSTKAKRLLAMLFGALFTMALVSVIIMALWNYLLVDRESAGDGQV